MRSASFSRPARNAAWYSAAACHGQGDVQREAESRAGAGFVLRPGSGIERKAMDRQEADPLGVVEDLLGAVAVVDIEIDDQNAVEIEPFEASAAARATLAKMQNPMPSPGRA